ncbi:MAG: ABC transporter ATP-binding protein [Pseudobdellovibrionaceae bacterium]
MTEVLLKAEDIYKSYSQGSSSLQILKGISFSLSAGQACVILGASGAGKSTLLHILGNLDRPNQGHLYFAGHDCLKMSDEQLSELRNQKMGFVFQFHHLMSELTALENVLLPEKIANIWSKHSQEKAESLLQTLGVWERRHHYPSQMSGGELQRVAIARALIRQPQILFADEPTGNLDSKNAGQVQDLFFELKEKLNLSLVVVTHDLQFAGRFAKILRMKDGRWE